MELDSFTVYCSEKEQALNELFRLLLCWYKEPATITAEQYYWPPDHLAHLSPANAALALKLWSWTSWSLSEKKLTSLLSTCCHRKPEKWSPHLDCSVTAVHTGIDEWDGNPAQMSWYLSKWPRPIWHEVNRHVYGDLRETNQKMWWTQIISHDSDHKTDPEYPLQETFLHWCWTLPARAARKKFLENWFPDAQHFISTRSDSAAFHFRSCITYKCRIKPLSTGWQNAHGLPGLSSERNIQKRWLCSQWPACCFLSGHVTLSSCRFDRQVPQWSITGRGQQSKNSPWGR